MAFRNREEDKLERREEQAQRENGGQQGEKQKKSWKEIDAGRDGKRSSSRDDRGPRPAKGESLAYRSYKSKLDKLFDGEIKMPQATVVEVIRKPELPTAVKAAPVAVAAAPLTPRERLKAAEALADIETAARECIAAGGLPNDTELVAKVFQTSDEPLFLNALEALLDLMERGRPKNAKAIVGLIAARQPQLTDKIAIDLAGGIRARLGG
jgi:hypothetical protein